MIVQLAGLPGVGKSTLAEELARHLDPVLLLCKDRVRHALFGAEQTRYTRDQDDFCVELMLQAAAWQLRQAPTTIVILDGRTCSHAYQVEHVRAFAHRMGQPLRLIECVCHDQIALARLDQDHAHGGHPAANRTPELYRRLRADAEPIPPPKLLIDTSAPVADCRDRALNYVTGPESTAPSGRPRPRCTAARVTADLAALLDIAHTVIDLGVTYVRAYPPIQVTAKSDRDMVTDVDLTVERLIRTALHTRTPQIPVLGEEEGGDDTSTRWVLDPVDGTANFARGLPLNGISLALVRDDQAVLGVICLPFLRRRYWAATGIGAWRDGQPITAARTTTLADAIVTIGDYGTGPGAEPRNHAAFALHAYLAPRVQRIRMLGSAAVDLAWVADGGLDASVTLGNRAWDMAAGCVIAREAGAAVIDVDDTQHRATSRFTIATAPRLRADILAAVQHATTITGFTGHANGPAC